MQTFVKPFVAVMLLSGVLSAGEATRYFKEDHLTGADYIALAPDGTYTVTGREHVGVFANESGRWSRSDARIRFAPSGSGKNPYGCIEVVYRGHLFLALEDEAGPSIVVPIENTKRELDKNPKVLPPYVFFQISALAYQRETKQSYPFKYVH